MRNQTGIVDIKTSAESNAPATLSDMFDGDYSEYLAHVDNFCNIANAEFSSFNFPIRFSPNHLHRLNQNGDLGYLDNDGLIAAFVQNQRIGINTDGMIHEPQTRTFVDVIITGARVSLNNIDLSEHDIIEALNKVRNKQTYLSSACINTLGAMQCGKTGTANGSDFIAPVMYLLTGVKHYPINLLTNRSGQVSQAVAEYKTFIALYGKIEIQLIDEGGQVAKVTTLGHMYQQSNTLQKYQNNIMKRATRLSPTLNLDLEEKRLNVEREISRLSKKRKNKNIDEQAIISMQQRSADARRIKMIRDVCDIAKQEDFRIVFKVDEIHWGAADAIHTDATGRERGGVMARFLQPIHDTVVEQKDGHLIIGLSATPFQIAFLENVPTVYHRLGEGYCGPNFFNGEPIDPNVELNLPDVQPLSARLGGGPILSLASYLNSATFSKWKTSANYQGTYEEYQVLFENGIKQVIEDILFRRDDVPLATCLRGVNSNSKMREFVNSLNLSPDIHVAYYNGDGNGDGQSIKEFIRTTCRNKKKILIVVTGAARMADAFPTMYLDGSTFVPLRWSFIDLTNKTTTQAALMQGLYGRACGYGKIIDGERPLVIVSDSNYQQFVEYHETLGRIVMNPMNDTVRVGGGSGREFIQLPLMRDMKALRGDTVMSKMFRSLQIRVANKIGADSLRGLKSTPYPVWEIISEDVLKHIENRARELWPEIPVDIRFLRPVFEVVEGDEPFYDTTKNGYGTVNFRSVNEDDKKTGGGGDMTNRDIRRLVHASGGRKLDDVTKAHKANGLRPQIFVRKTTKGWQVRGIILRLDTLVAEKSWADRVLPVGPEAGTKTGGTIGHRYRTAAEVAAVEEIYETRRKIREKREQNRAKREAARLEEVA